MSDLVESKVVPEDETNSPEIKFKGVEHSHVICKLGELYNITSGGTPSRQHKEYYEKGSIPWVKVCDLHDVYLFVTDEKITPEGLSNSTARIYPANSVILAMYSTSVGEISILKIDAATNQACAVFTPNSSVIPLYLYMFLEKQKPIFIRDAIGCAQPNLSAGYLKQVKIPLPPIEEQLKVTSIFDEIVNLTHSTKLELTQLQSLKASMLEKMFPQDDADTPILGFKDHTATYRNVRIDEVFDLQFGFTPSRNNQKYWSDGVNSWVSIGDLSGYDKYTGSTKEKISELAVSGNQAKCVPANTVIMSFKLSLGKVAITSEDLYTNEAIMAFIPKKSHEVLPDYVYHLFSATDWTKDSSIAVKGATLNTKQLKEIRINIPPFEEQQKIALILDELVKLISLYRHKLNKLNSIKQALLAKMFV